MDSFYSRFKNPLLLIAVVLLQVLALAMQVQRSGVHLDQASETMAPGEAPDTPRVTLLRRWTISVLTPVERLGHGASYGLRSLWTNYVGLRHTHEQNLALEHEVARLREEQAAFAEDAAQGRRLRAVLDFKQSYIAHTVAAQVIGTSGTDRSHVLYLDKGSADGLKPDMAVMTPDGVVGKLRDVFPHTAQLLLLDDASSGAGVLLRSTRMRGILTGAPGGAVQIDNLTADPRIKPGETVVTSGGDGVFPRGLPVGTITSVALDPHHQPFTTIAIKPAANLQRLEEVLVITQTDAQMPQLAQSDAATAEAKAAENQRAADLIAQKLPSLHEDEAEPGSTPTGEPTAKEAADAKAAETSAAGVPGVPNSGVPKVQPTVHPDRYSVGATPPAADLTPGGANHGVAPPQ